MRMETRKQKQKIIFIRQLQKGSKLLLIVELELENRIPY